MDQSMKDKIMRQLIKLEGLGCLEPEISVTLRDTDLSPLQPQIGDHPVIAVGGVIRLEDYMAMKNPPMNPPATAPGGAPPDAPLPAAVKPASED